ncbi:hypothetical protein AQUCO_00100510v1 [Aquilegia coerulea]|uniref:Uncharacterized protein n=1 Tax=Aquilegia coerulea TaxID=218851 RepID=A0A2G5FAL1_AQUCA|nr:hypothetical protein AQUCO_00100510v1 [Aquilegia coerulea]
MNLDTLIYVFVATGLQELSIFLSCVYSWTDLLCLILSHALNLFCSAFIRRNHFGTKTKFCNMCICCRTKMELSL